MPKPIQKFVNQHSYLMTYWDMHYPIKYGKPVFVTDAPIVNYSYSMENKIPGSNPFYKKGDHWITKEELPDSDFRTAKGKIHKYLSKSSDQGCDEYGWGNIYKLSEKNMVAWNDETEAVAAVERHTAKSWDYIDQNYLRMKELAELCKSHQIQLVLITTPCWHSYYDNLNNKQLKKMYELTYKLQHEFHIFYFDYLKDPRFEADDFLDSNHLSDIGAIKFTKILDKDIRKGDKCCPSSPLRLIYPFQFFVFVFVFVQLRF